MLNQNHSDKCGFFMFNFIEEMITSMKEKKIHQVGVRLNESQVSYLDLIVFKLGLKTRSEGLQYIINKMRFLDIK